VILCDIARKARSAVSAHPVQVPVRGVSRRCPAIQAEAPLPRFPSAPLRGGWRALQPADASDLLSTNLFRSLVFPKAQRSNDLKCDWKALFASRTRQGPHRRERRKARWGLT